MEMTKEERGQVGSILDELYHGLEFGWGAGHDVPGRCYDLIAIAQKLWPNLCKEQEEAMEEYKKQCEEEENQ